MSTPMPNGTPAASDPAAQQANSGAPDPQTTQDTPALTQGQPAASQSEPGANGSGASTDVNNPAAQRAAQEAAKYRTELREAQKRIAEFEAAQKAADDAKLSDMERLQKQLAEEQAARARVETQAQERIIRSEVRSEAARLGINPQLAARIVDYAAIEYDDNGDPKNIADLLTTAAQEYGIAPAAQTPATPATPATAPRASAGAPASPARSATQNGGALTRDYIERMSPREYQVRRDEVQEWIRTHPNG